MRRTTADEVSDTMRRITADAVSDTMRRTTADAVSTPYKKMILKKKYSCCFCLVVDDVDQNGNCVTQIVGRTHRR